MTHYTQALGRCNQAMTRCQPAMVIAGLQCPLQVGNDVNTLGIGSLHADNWLLQVCYEALQ